MFFFKILQQKPKLFKRFTGLSKEQFNKLAGRLGPLWECSEQKRLNHKDRQRKVGGGMNYKLEGIHKKLFVVLIYYRLYVTQEFLGFLVGLNQSNISRLISKMTPLLLEAADPVLHEILESKDHEERAKNIEELLEKYPELKEVFADGTESPAQRPKNKVERKDYYSGKKKKHTMKHEIVCTSKRRVVHVSSLYPGTVHDKKICDSEQTIKLIPKKTSIILDLGYNGIQKEHPNKCIIIPPKKPKKGELKPVQKLIRKLISSRRVVVEHTIGSIKQFKIVGQIFRGRKNSFGKIFHASCALHNFRLSTIC